MAKKNVRADIPVGNIDRTVKLGENISARHIALGAGSPLTGQVDMVVFDGLLGNIKAARGPAISDSREKEAWNEQALTVIGMAAGQNLQTKNTVYWHINKVQKFMVFKFKGNEEQASLWGFDVVVSETGGRRNVSFNVPYSSPEGLLELGANIISKHAADGAGTILTAPLFDMTAFEDAVTTARRLRDDALAKDQASQANNELARNLCGYGEGQTSETPGTLYYMITQVRDLLLVAYDGNEEQLSTFGFNVVVSTSSSSGGGSAPAVVNISGVVTDSSTSLPLQNAVVTIYPTATGPSAGNPSATTDGSGNYKLELSDVTESVASTVEASLAGYAGSSIQLEVQPGNNYTAQDISLSPNP